MSIKRSDIDIQNQIIQNKILYIMAKKAEFVVVTKSWWQGSSPKIYRKFTDKKEALDKAEELHDGNLKTGQNAFVLSKSEFKKRYPLIFREEY